jgi:hypothetical protein
MVIYKWHLYYKGSNNMKAALEILSQLLQNSKLEEINQLSIRCEFVESQGSDNSAWRAIRLTLFGGPHAGKYLA